MATNRRFLLSLCASVALGAFVMAPQARAADLVVGSERRRGEDLVTGAQHGAHALEVLVDPTIIGGLVVKLGSRMVDSSLRTKLNAIKHAMKEVA